MNRLNQTSSHVVCAPCVPSAAAGESVVSGECNCGAVTYSVSGDPMNVLICHCQDCREAHGSPMSTVFVCKADQIKIDGPNQADFLKIFALVARKRRVPLNEDALIHLLQTKYPTIDNVYSNYQPVFLIDQMISICEFEGKPYHMSPELIDRAWSNMFVRDETIIR